jgi:DNA-binding transcriptional ArsR family regulator
MDALIRAVGDETRRDLLELLREGERTAGELALPFRMTNAAISQHLKVLREADLVRVRSEGRLRIYSLNAAPLRELFDWAAHYKEFWPKRLASLGSYLDEMGDE